MITDYQLDRIVQIDWKLKEKTDEKTDSAFTTVSFGGFLEEHFPHLDCESIISKFKKAIKDANDDIGFETIPRLSLRYLSNFKDDINYKLSHEKYRDMRFLLLPNSENKEDLSNIVLDDGDYKICDDRFINGELYKSLLGEEGFAKCFVTAEYQYHVFNQGNSFDYTSVVCGYLKAIEQLLYKLLKINLDNPSDDRLWILRGKNVPKERQRIGETTRRNPATGKWQVVFDKDFETYFNITLSPMIWFLHDNANGWLISDDGRKKVHKFLLNFANDCRNDHFHKDNIDDYEVVKGIRNNTILLVYLLIGGYKMTASIEEDKKLLGIRDDSFDRLYKRIQEIPRGIKKFILKYADGKIIKAYRHFYQENTKYDSSGSVSMSKIKCVLVDDFSMEVYDAAMSGEMADKEFYIEKDNLPSYVAYMNGRDEEVQIDF